MPTPDPRLLARRAHTWCSRYTRDGERCTTPTTNTDGWCRTCAGFTTAAPRPPGGRRRYYSTPLNPAPCPVDTYEVSNLGVTRNAITRYITAHQAGTRDQVEAAIRALAEDLIHMGRWRLDPGGWLVLAHQGFLVTISPDLADIVDYRTTHAERTWPQVKSGVTSRLRTTRRNRSLDRRRKLRVDALSRAGVAHTDRRAPDHRSLTLTGPDGRTLTWAGRTLRDLSVAHWQDLVTRARTELDVTIDPLTSKEPQP